jgi:hypothetical protein
MDGRRRRESGSSDTDEHPESALDALNASEHDVDELLSDDGKESLQGKDDADSSSEQLEEPENIEPSESNVMTSSLKPASSVLDATSPRY